MSSREGKQQVGRTAADGRPLSGLDKLYFRYGISHIAAIFVFKSILFRSDEKVKAAYMRTIEMCPLMQTEIIGEEDDAEPYFSQMVSKDDWPSIKIQGGHNDDEEALEAARSVILKEVSEFTRSIDARRKAARLTMVRGKATVVFCFAVPHPFSDAAGGFACLKKFLLYAVLARPFWPLIDRRSRDKSVPTDIEMALKDRSHLYRDVELSRCERYDSTNFRFDYDSRAPTALSLLGGLDFQSVGKVKPKRMKQIRSALRQSGTTLTSALAAVAMKTLAAIIVASGYENPGPLVFMTAVDPRPMGKWGDERDKGNQFPITANYSFLTFTQISFEDLMTETIEQVAVRIKKNVSRVRSDINFLLQELKATYTPDGLGYVCGCSSILVPSTAARLGLSPIHFESGIRFGTKARCWMTAITFGGQTDIVADIMLPIEGLTEETVRARIDQVVEGTVVEPLFNSM